MARQAPQGHGRYPKGDLMSLLIFCVILVLGSGATGALVHRSNTRCEEEKRLLKITSTDRDEARQENRALREEAVILRQKLDILRAEAQALRTSTAVLKASAED